MFHPRRFFRKLGPGIITGASDDDPSGIVTYSQTGAAFGYTFLWLALFTAPLMMAVQEMSARLGMVSKRGLATLIRQRYSKRVALVVSLLLLVVNTINIGADLSAMGEVGHLLWKWPSWFFAVVFALGIIGLEIFVSYRRYVNILKWLTLALLSYFLAAFFVHQDWSQIALHSFLPHWPSGANAWYLIVAILGTTISPYLFFWQSSEEVEDHHHQATKSPAQLSAMRKDVSWGMIFSNVTMFFIIITTAGALNRHGVTNISTAAQAAEALRPFAGSATYWLFSLGIFGTGLLAIPVLAGSAAYSFAEVFDWREGLSKKMGKAPQFYLALALSIVFGLAMHVLGVSAISLLIFAAVLNGLLAPIMIFFLLRLADDRTIVGDQVSPSIVRWGGWIAFTLMTLVGLVVLVQLF